jgi:TetR/AcrR family transcriptional regulator
MSTKTPERDTPDGQNTTPRRVRRTRDAKRTQKRILDAAELSFAKGGLEGASTEAIARRAGVSKTMLFYYFNSKEELYLAVLKRLFESVIDSDRAARIETMAPREGLHALVTDYVSIHFERPSYAELTMRETMAYGGKYLQRLKYDLPFIGQMIRTIRRGSLTGAFRPVDPLKVTLSIIGMTKVFFTYREAIERVLDRPLLTPEAISEWREHMVDLLLNGVSVCPPTGDKPLPPQEGVLTEAFADKLPGMF